MNISVEISMYPLKEDFKPLIIDFIKRLHQHEGLKVTSSSISTHIFGDYSLIMKALDIEMKQTFGAGNAVVFTLKILNRMSDSDEVDVFEG